MENEKSDENELWMNPLFFLEDRLEIARGAINHRDKIIANLRKKLGESVVESKPGPQVNLFGKEFNLMLIDELKNSFYDVEVAAISDPVSLKKELWYLQNQARKQPNRSDLKLRILAIQKELRK